MKMEEALKVFKTKTKLASALGVSKSTVSGWGETIPPLRALQAEKVTKGKLKADFPAAA